MLSVRELKVLAQKLDGPSFARQVGPFSLVERPYEKTPDGPVPKATTVLGRQRVASLTPFEDLWVATLPPVTEMDAFSIGRSADCDIVLDEETVSKRHARIDWLGDGAELEDLSSSNGTFVNGQRLKGRSRLEDNDALSFGDVQVLFLHAETLRRLLQR